MFEMPLKIVNNEISYYSMQSDTEILSFDGRLFTFLFGVDTVQKLLFDGLSLLNYLNLHFFFYLQQLLLPWNPIACFI